MFTMIRDVKVTSKLEDMRMKIIRDENSKATLDPEKMKDIIVTRKGNLQSPKFAKIYLTRT